MTVLLIMRSKTTDETHAVKLTTRPGARHNQNIFMEAADDALERLHCDVRCVSHEDDHVKLS